MRRLLSILLVLLLVTGCAPQSVEPTAAPSVEHAPTLAPAPTPEPTAEDALHELLADYAPQSLNMFRPFEPIAISPEQFMEEMAVIRALPFEQRTDWFVEHGLCIPEPSEDTDVDWQMETNLWSTYADYRCCTQSEMITGCKDGIETQWQFVYSDPLNSGGAQRCGYVVLFERAIGAPWELVDVLYRPEPWQGSEGKHMLFSLLTERTFSLYDPSARKILLTLPEGEMDVTAGDTVTRYVTYDWALDVDLPLSRLTEDKYARCVMIYERYPAGQIELDKRKEFGGYGLIYTMENHRPTLVKELLLPGCDRTAFLISKADELVEKEYTCPPHNPEDGDGREGWVFPLTKGQEYVLVQLHERTEPISAGMWWEESPTARVLIYTSDEQTLLQTIDLASIDRLAVQHIKDSEERDILPPKPVLSRINGYRDLNLDGYNDLELTMSYGYTYCFLWEEEKQEFVFWRAAMDIVLDAETCTLTYYCFCGEEHADHIRMDGSIVPAEER